MILNSITPVVVDGLSTTISYPRPSRSRISLSTAPIFLPAPTGGSLYNVPRLRDVAFCRFVYTELYGVPTGVMIDFSINSYAHDSADRLNDGLGGIVLLPICTAAVSTVSKSAISERISWHVI